METFKKIKIRGGLFILFYYFLVDLLDLKVYMKVYLINVYKPEMTAFGLDLLSLNQMF